MTAPVPQAAVDAAAEAIDRHSLHHNTGRGWFCLCGETLPGAADYIRHRAAAVVAAMQGPLQAQALRDFATDVRASGIPTADYVAPLADDYADQIEADQ